MSTQKYRDEHSVRPEDCFLTRRQFLNRAGMGFGALSLASLMGPGLATEALATANNPLAPRAPHFPAKAKRVVHIFAQGAPSHVDTFDPKPALAQWDGKSISDAKGVAMASPFKFEKCGRSGIEVSEIFPRLREMVDDLCFIRSMYTDIPAHEVATVFMNTGHTRLARPSIGSWVLYGLGTESENLPGYISLRPGGSIIGGTQNWGSAFLPGVYQAMSVNTATALSGQVIENLRNAYTVLPEQRRQLDLVHRLNELHARNLQREAALEARLEAFEMAFRMQTEATDAFDVMREPASVRERYGNSRQGVQLLIARRLLERGVRFLQVWDGGWDHHQELAERLAEKARGIDQPLAAFLADLKERGLFDSTLVVWGGEFGRTPTRD
ncbi:MAG TPA: DUF1501 domain-containing protein, partial [Methylomirabilota bacterium]|nr:DUF1501 domain-containing protein [Methylomirabilota bacterium]